MSSDDIMNTVIPVVAILAVFGLPIGYLIIHRLLSYNERMAMIRQGMTPPPDSRWARRAAREGWFDPASGGTAPPQGFYPMDGWRAQRKLQKGVSLTLIGLGLTIAMAISRPTDSSDLLVGLIPMFIGLAQVANAWLMGARFGPGFGAGFASMFGPPPPGMQAPPPYTQRPGASAPPPANGPYAWRPGGVTELEAPLKPPEKR